MRARWPVYARSIRETARQATLRASGGGPATGRRRFVSGVCARRENTRPPRRSGAAAGLRQGGR
ncbi:hypothetical protein C7S16_5592 [Burkholderia thailandensis]|uniref:Uncharacterized protein n=1 Tax=Burkholderia thailandensis TaxID=57975 RepID=A0AAW9CK47_BURTH|nr:hypothetical protein [Burkholderia thailandensis]MDW9250880.1 hypothetical protein [Burkholderia thailandensis]